MIAAAFCLVLGALAAVTWAYYNLHGQHRHLEASAARAARLLFRQRRRIQQLTADLAETERHLTISHLVCDTLAYDLAEAIRPVTDWEPPVAPTATPVHDAVIVDLFARELEKPMDQWSL